jgi:hypothetical protein
MFDERIINCGEWPPVLLELIPLIVTCGKISKTGCKYNCHTPSEFIENIKEEC